MPPNEQSRSPLIFLVLIIGIALGVFMFLRGGSRAPYAPGPDDGVACTADAMLCPDGSYVGRTPPNCAFAACPLAEIPAANATLSGHVVISPVCPVERMPPDPTCAPRGYETEVWVRPAGSLDPVARARTDASGAFRFALPAGAYEVGATAAAVYPRCPVVSVVVNADKRTTLLLSCDSGIR